MQLIDIAYASETAEPTEEGGVAASLGINSTLFVFQLINFAIVAAIIWFLILKPLTKKMSERQRMIDESIDNSKKIQETLARSEQKYQERIDEAKVEANKIMEKASAEATQVAGTMKEKAKQEIDGLVEQAKRHLQSEREDMVAKFKQDAGGLIATALEKILEEKVDSKKDTEIIESMVKKLR